MDETVKLAVNFKGTMNGFDDFDLDISMAVNEKPMAYVTNIKYKKGALSLGVKDAMTFLANLTGVEVEQLCKDLDIESMSSLTNLEMDLMSAFKLDVVAENDDGSDILDEQGNEVKVPIKLDNDNVFKLVNIWLFGDSCG